MAPQAGTYGHPQLADFSLDSSIIHLNHGSYGAVPLVLAAEQQMWRDRIERDPTTFFRRQLPGLLREAAAAAADEFGGRADDWVFVENATQAANAAIPALGLGEGDHVLATSEIYNAVRQALHHHGGRHGAHVQQIDLPLPVRSDEEIISAFERAFTSATKAVFLDHITSRSAIVMPVAEITRRAKARGSAVFIDGAHAPGMIGLEVPGLGADWYTGNAHKWLCGPRGCGILWTSPEWQRQTHPVTISHGYGSGYAAEFDWVGTRDVTPWLCLPRVLQWHREQGGGELRAHLRRLALKMGERLADRFETGLSAPPGLMGSMACVRLPGPSAADALKALDDISAGAQTAVSLNRIAGSDWLRVSAAIYNELEDVDRLIGFFDRESS